MKSSNKIFCVISHTHWDREWYMPLENFRHRLTDLMDRLLDILAREESYIFHLDAQTVVLEDYLLVRPEKEGLLKDYISRRRIIIGPWYLQNDFYLTSGESTVRNLLEGDKLCRAFGGKSKAGYAADQFGNPSQMPQIMRQFGYDNFIFGRGVARYDISEEGKAVPKPTPTEFIWKGADGSEVLAIHMRHWYNNAQRFSSDVSKAEKLLKEIGELYDNEYTLTPYLLLMNGVDHLEAQPDILEICDAVSARLPEGQEMLQYNMDDYVEAVKDYLSFHSITPETVEGELRQSPDIPVLQGTLSSRIYLKTANDEAQVLLENRLEPLYAMMEAGGLQGIYPADRLRYTWKNLMKNHPHDSICGCSHDGVHRHMENRYGEIFEFAGEQLRRGLEAYADHTAAARKADPDAYLITVINTLSFPMKGACRVRAKLLKSDNLSAFLLLDEDGTRVNYTLLSHEVRETNVYSPINLPGTLDIDDFELIFDPGEVPAYSSKVFTLTRAEKPAPIHALSDKTLSIENETCLLTATPSGGLTLTDKKNGRVLKDFILLEDLADAGDSYGFNRAGDTPLTDFACKVRMIEKTSYSGTLELSYLLPLPLELKNGKRMGDAPDSRLTLRLTLNRGESFLHMDYSVENHAKDHRLRIGFAADLLSDGYLTDIPFDLVHHTVRDFYPGTPTKTSPFASFAALEDGKKGLALLTCGIHEVEQTSDHTFFFTLLRSTGAINKGGSENWLVPENQCLRTVSGRMALVLYQGSAISANLQQTSQAFRAPLLAVCTPADNRKFAGGRPCVQDTELQEYFYLPDTHPNVGIESSSLTIDGKGIQVTAFKKSEDRSCLVLRLVNLSSESTQITVSYPGRIFKSRLDEISRIYLGKQRVTLPVTSKEILTLCLK